MTLKLTVHGALMTYDELAKVKLNENQSKLSEKVVDYAVAEMKMFLCDCHAVQLAQVRQALYLSITLAGAVCAVVANTTFLGKPDAILKCSEAWPIALMGVAFLLAVATFIIGVCALRGERRNRQISFTGNYANTVLHDESADVTRLHLLDHLSTMKQGFIRDIDAKGGKIRWANALLIATALTAAVGTFSIFVTTYQEGHYDVRRTTSEEISVPHSGTGATRQNGGIGAGQEKGF